MKLRQSVLTSVARLQGRLAFELQMEWLRKVCDFAVAHGNEHLFLGRYATKICRSVAIATPTDVRRRGCKRWNTERLVKLIQMFPKDCIYMRWHYEDLQFCLTVYCYNGTAA